MVMECD